MPCQGSETLSGKGELQRGPPSALLTSTRGNKSEIKQKIRYEVSKSIGIHPEFVQFRFRYNDMSKGKVKSNAKLTK